MRPNIPPTSPHLTHRLSITRPSGPTQLEINNNSSNKIVPTNTTHHNLSPPPPYGRVNQQIQRNNSTPVQQSTKKNKKNKSRWFLNWTSTQVTFSHEKQVKREHKETLKTFERLGNTARNPQCPRQTRAVKRLLFSSERWAFQNRWMIQVNLRLSPSEPEKHTHTLRRREREESNKTKSKHWRRYHRPSDQQLENEIRKTSSACQLL